MFKDDILTITIVNNTKTAMTWNAFGYNQGLQNSPGVSVIVAESSLQQANRQSAQTFFDVKQIKIRTNDNNQLDNPITFAHSDATGQNTSVQIVPSDYVDIMNSIPRFVRIDDPGIIITGKDSFSGVINANSRMEVIIKLKKAAKKSNFINSLINLFAPGSKISITGPVKSGGKIVIN